ncbi:uncharacterized protein Ga0609869_002999 [Rhodovulum iodosum]|uniref:Thioesterase domain-containing protein n=1 Tax=Rhodovulum iodosum TaxID=68291 RepID=A0ABV3XWA4_9RHOB|nr:PaaI family thioesterase [Rhodovulum robiginosum]RSK36776.1 PaaI family thioesterase [Rhodovulum robiginosum]
MTQPKNPDFATAVRESFARQGLMTHLGAEIVSLVPGAVTIAAPIRPETGQQHGYAHAGLSFSLGDTAAGYSALSLLPPGHEVLTSEIKIHLLAPARGERLVAEGGVIRPGRRLMIVRAEIYAEDGADRAHVATLLGTMVPMALEPR